MLPIPVDVCLQYGIIAAVGLVVGCVAIVSKCCVPETSIVKLLFFYLALLDVYFDVSFNANLCKLAGWNYYDRFFLFSSCHLLSTIPVNIALVTWWLWCIRDSGWFVTHRTSALLHAVIVIGFFGPNALLVLQSRLFGMDVFKMNVSGRDRLNAMLGLFGLYENVPQLGFQVCSLLGNRSSSTLTIAALCVSSLCALLHVATGIVNTFLWTPGARTHDYEILLAVDTDVTGPIEATAPVMLRAGPMTAQNSLMMLDTGPCPSSNPAHIFLLDKGGICSLPPWVALMWVEPSRAFVGSKRTRLGEKIARLDIEHAVLSNFTWNKDGTLDDDEICRISGRDRISIDQFEILLDTYMQRLAAYSLEGALMTLVMLDPPELAGCRQVVGFERLSTFPVHGTEPRNLEEAIQGLQTDIEDTTATPPESGVQLCRGRGFEFKPASMTLELPGQLSGASGSHDIRGYFEALLVVYPTRGSAGRVGGQARRAIRFSDNSASGTLIHQVDNGNVHSMLVKGSGCLIGRGDIIDFKANGKVLVVDISFDGAEWRRKIVEHNDIFLAPESIPIDMELEAWLKKVRAIDSERRSAYGCE